MEIAGLNTSSSSLWTLVVQKEYAPLDNPFLPGRREHLVGGNGERENLLGKGKPSLKPHQNTRELMETSRDRRRQSK